MTKIEKAGSIKHWQGHAATQEPTHCQWVCNTDHHFGKLLGFYFYFLTNFFWVWLMMHSIILVSGALHSNSNSPHICSAHRKQSYHLLGQFFFFLKREHFFCDLGILLLGIIQQKWKHMPAKGHEREVLQQLFQTNQIPETFQVSINRMDKLS